MVWCLLVLEPVVVVPPLETTFLVLETFKVEVEEEVRDFPAALTVDGGGGGGGGGVGAVAAKALLLSLPADGPVSKFAILAFSSFSGSSLLLKKGVDTAAAAD